MTKGQLHIGYVRFIDAVRKELGQFGSNRTVYEGIKQMRQRLSQVEGELAAAKVKIEQMEKSVCASMEQLDWVGESYNANEKQGDFGVGYYCILVSGGPLMTIVGFSRNGNVWCEWKDEDKRIQEASFVPEMLRKPTDEERRQW